MKKLTCFLFISFIFLFTACKKETGTDAQLISNRLQEVIKNEAVVRVIPTTDYVPGGTISYQPGYGKSYQFNPPFISIESISYNLGSLKKYYISYIDNEKTLFLVF